MAENIALKIMRCPTCGSNLKAVNDSDAITCVYCGNTIVPVKESAPTKSSDSAQGFMGGVLKVEGIKTSSSALAYIELFFEEYDWEAFAYDQLLSIPVIDRLANSLKSSSADDKNTWFACFKAAAVPFINKAENCGHILLGVIREYKEDNLDAYSKFDAYKRIATKINNNKNVVVDNLRKIVDYAVKYGATADEIRGLNADIEKIKNIYLDVYSDVKSIPDVKKFIDENNSSIAQKLRASGIDADAQYRYAKSLISDQKYTEALSALLVLDGYLDSEELITKINRYYLVSDALEVGGQIYYYKSNENSYSNAIDLYPTENGMICDKPIIKNISKVITNYADMLYYIDDDGYLMRCILSTRIAQKIANLTLDKNSVYVYKKRVFLLQKKESATGRMEHHITELDLATGTTKVILGNVDGISEIRGNKLVYTISEKIKEDAYNSVYRTITNILDVDTMKIVSFGAKNITIEGFVDDNVIYTQATPNENNNNLYVKSFDSQEPERLIEQNIYGFCSIVAGKLFYYIGNSFNQTLININCDGTERNEWPLYVSKVLFEQGGWLYFIRKAGYNAVLCKSRMDGSKFSVIASEIDRFVTLRDGYLYYINDSHALLKVRMDGSNLQKLCNNVLDVLSIKDDKIIYLSQDDNIRTRVGESQFSSTETVNSIYAIDFSGSGKIKLVYNVKNAKEYDDNTVYYVASGNVTSSYETLENQEDKLYKLDVRTNNVEMLLRIIQKPKQEESKLSMSVVIFIISFLIMIVGFAAEAIGLGVISMFVAIGSVAVLIGKLSNKSDEQKPV